jgi:hypothetical protein
MNRTLLYVATGLLILGTAALAMAGSPASRPHYLVTNMDDNSSYWFTILTSSNTSSCNDTDNGAKPLNTGTIDVYTLNPVGHRVLTDYNVSGYKVREFVCGIDIYPSGIPFYATTKAYLMVWDPTYQAP